MGRKFDNPKYEFLTCNEFNVVRDDDKPPVISDNVYRSMVGLPDLTEFAPKKDVKFLELPGISLPSLKS